MCALEAQQQLDHEVIASYQPVILNEVILIYDDVQGVHELSLDPGKVRAMFWDQRAELYLEAGRPRSAFSLRDKTPFRTAAANGYARSGGNGSCLYFEMNNGTVLVSQEEVATSHIIALYHSPGLKQSFQLELQTKNVHPMGADVVFWDGAVCEKYRHASGLSGPHALFRPDGTAHKTQLPGQGGGYSTAMFTPIPPTRQPAYHSKTCNLCYHYENCQWSCTVDAA